MAKTGEQDKDGPSSLQGSEYMIYFILRADIIQPDYQISFKRRVNNVTICLWLKHRKINMEGFQPRGGGYSHTLPIRVCAAQRGRDFDAPDLEWGIHFRGVFYNGV